MEPAPTNWSRAHARRTIGRDLGVGPRPEAHDRGAEEVERAPVSKHIPPELADLTDEELDRYVLARLEIVGVDLSVLPQDDASAPADRARILRSARTFLRTTLPAIADLRIDPDHTLPALYPSVLPRPAESGPDGR